MPNRYPLGGALLIGANVASGAAVVVYHAFLPQIAESHERDGVSRAAGPSGTRPVRWY